MLIESFGNLLSDNKFLSWLANKLGFFPSRLKTLIDSYEKVFLPRNRVPDDVLNEIYYFWIKNSIPSTDRRSGPDEMCITKIRYMHVHKHTLDLEDENITEFTKVEKNGTSKIYRKGHHMTYTKAIRKMHTDFVASRDNIQCSLSTFSDISHFTLHHLQREKKSHAFVLNVKTSIYFYRE